MREFMLAEMRFQDIQAEAARNRLAEEARGGERRGLDLAAAMRRSLQSTLGHAHSLLADLEWTLLTLRRGIHLR